MLSRNLWSSPFPAASFSVGTSPMGDYYHALAGAHAARENARVAPQLGKLAGIATGIFLVMRFL